jgi:hypothetical protein
MSCVSFADHPANWQAGVPTPGNSYAGARNVDTDGDGAPDELEFLAGTDPANSQDFLRFDRVSSDGINCILEFTGHSSHSYTVEKLSLWARVASGQPFVPTCPAPAAPWLSPMRLALRPTFTG